MKVLVTGAGGYIGKHVVKELLKYDGIDVIAVDLNASNIDPRAIVKQMNIFNGDKTVINPRQYKLLKQKPLL